MFGEGDWRKGWFIAPQTSAPPIVSSVLSSASQPSPASNLLRYLLFGFLGGIILNVMPCVLPVITLKIYGFISQAGQSRRRILELGLAYCAGVFAWFLGLAALIVAFGLNWSFQFQNKGFVVVMLVICAIFGLNLLGAFEVFLPASLNTGLAVLASKGRPRRRVRPRPVCHAHGVRVYRASPRPRNRLCARAAPARDLRFFRHHSRRHGASVPSAHLESRLDALPAKAGHVDGARQAMHGRACARDRDLVRIHSLSADYSEARSLRPDAQYRTQVWAVQSLSILLPSGASIAS